KDLEIRGAGNLLGGEQSGHIADVGFDLYIRLVCEAVSDFRGEDTEPEPEMRIELAVDANLPVDYVESERLRLEMYKRLAEVRSDADIAEVEAELTDRYGPLPEAASALLDVARFRLLCREVGLTEVITQGNAIRFGPASLPESREMRLMRLHPGSVIKSQAGFVLVPRPMTARVAGEPIVGPELLTWATHVVRDIFAPLTPLGS
ncbi:MAG TPA: TRCF domain-containing protein, partial [Propionibacteriaceae bacterium]|nr:TRCF domain-containing protein [Propionibacteriaceae bacterium]